MADLTQISDEQLARCVSDADNGEVVAELVSRYTGLVLSLAAKYCGSADYEELVSEGLESLINAASSFDPERGSFSGFAFVCISNRMKNVVKCARKRADRFPVVSDEDFSDSVPSPEELVIGQENADEITYKMKSVLSPLELRCIEGVILGMTYTELSENLSISVKSVDNAVTRARNKLRNVLPQL